MLTNKELKAADMVLYPTDPGTHGFLAYLFKSKPHIDNLVLHVTETGHPCRSEPWLTMPTTA